MKPSATDAIENATIELAESILRAALAQRTSDEAAQANRVAGLISDPTAKRLSIAMTDRLIRSADPIRATLCFRSLIARLGTPKSFTFFDRVTLSLGAFVSRLVPSIVLKMIRSRLRFESRSVILSAEPALLGAYLTKRRSDGIRVNLNQLGEAVLGEEEALRRLESVEALLSRTDTDYVSVKISAIFSQINLLAWDDTVSEIKSRLRRLYRIALANNKFVNLDMEEYRDLALTVAVFRELLDEPEFHQLYAGIVLQAYLPDAAFVQRELTEWARQRVANGGSKIKIRLVKGANLAMESVEAELHGWNRAPFEAKSETDANFRRMLEYACQPTNASVVRLGVGSHNLFDVALALVLREANNVRDAIEIEMLEGMANDLARAIRDEAGSLLVYAPIVLEKDFGSALAYLLRRLDENTLPENFLSEIFALVPGSEAWERQRLRFVHGWRNRHSVSSESRRKMTPTCNPTKFQNEPDTDWTQVEQRNKLWHAIDTIQNVPSTNSTSEPNLPKTQIDGDASVTQYSEGAAYEVARSQAEVWERSSTQGDLQSIDRVLSIAQASQVNWELRNQQERSTILRQCAETMASQRFETIALLRTEAKKSIREADGEVSEAIDFARYYGATNAFSADTKALGVVVITPPWNFPYAIPGGGILAALMAGNSVILKPSPNAIGVAWQLVQQLWKSGVPRDVLQYVACEDGPLSQQLICDSRTSAVVLTGSYETARMFQAWRPSLSLFAETSGKNAIVVSALADRDLAIKDLIQSAFGHSGQKCSAASLGILEADVYDDPIFLRQLRDAVASLKVGPSTDPGSVVTPLVCMPGIDLQRALTELDSGESWLLEPEQGARDSYLWSPGIRLGVKAGSWFHQTECFGPVLGLMRARDLKEATEIQNSVSYGLTAGFHSLDETEIDTWRDKVEAGNLYINRPITGAIVQRQPFGGWKQSSIGPGSKAGGPNYVNLFRRQVQAASYDFESLDASYRASFRDYFSQLHDPTSLRCESNLFRYRPCRGVLLRLNQHDELHEAIARLASELCDVPLEISVASKESDSAFAARLPELAKRFEFLRTVATPSDEILRACHASGINWIDSPFSSDGRLELTRWLREQSISETRHRYGSIMS